MQQNESEIRVPPHSVEAEMGLLGAVLLDPEILDECRPHVTTPNAFYRPAHQIAWKILTQLDERKVAVDLVTFREEMIRQDLLVEFGDVEYLVQLVESVPSSANAVHYAKVVAEKWQLRRAIMLGQQAMTAGYDPMAKPAEVIGGAMREAESILELQPSRGMTALAAVDQLWGRLAEGRCSHVDTGYKFWDVRSGGIPLGEMTAVAARTSIGKTTFCLNVLRQMAEQGTQCAFISCEMTIEQIAAKLAAQVTDHSEFKIRADRLSESEKDELRDRTHTIYREYGEWLWLEDGIDDIDAICARLRLLQRKHGVQVACIDYLQMLTGSDARKPYERVSAYSHALKRFARHSGIGMIVVVQCNRSPEARADKQPTLGDLRDSGVTEEDAGVVVLLHRPEGKFKDGAEDSRYDRLAINVAKNRLGATTSFELPFAPWAGRVYPELPEVQSRMPF